MSAYEYISIIILMTLFTVIILLTDYENFDRLENQLTAYQDSVNVLIAENIRLNEVQFELSVSIIKAMNIPIEPMNPMVYAVEVEQ